MRFLFLQVGSLVSALIIFGVAGLATCCAVAVYIELSTFLPSAGGDYEYIRVAFGNMSGFTYAWMMCVYSTHKHFLSVPLSFDE